MKYNVGDRVRIKSLDWYNENKNKYGNVDCGFKQFTYEMSKFCGQTMIITEISSLNVMTMGMSAHYWTDEMIEGLAEEETPLDKAGQMTDFEYEGLAYTLPEGYQFIDENGNVINATKIVLEKKKKEYPNNFYHCVRTLGLHSHPDDASKYKTELIRKFQTLLVCRDAYWKLAGEEMGLGKPWKPKLDNNEKIYYIHNVSGKVYECEGREIENQIFAFPTPEMRDAFKENFDPDIEICKELL